MGDAAVYAAASAFSAGPEILGQTHAVRRSVRMRADGIGNRPSGRATRTPGEAPAAGLR